MHSTFKPRGFLLNGGILEYKSLSQLTPAAFTKAGVILYSAEPKWLMPFRETYIMTNLNPIIPDKTIGLVTPLSRPWFKWADVKTSVVEETNSYYVYVRVRNQSLIPRKIDKNIPLALLTVLPYVELHYVKNNDIDDN